MNRRSFLRTLAAAPLVAKAAPAYALLPWQRRILAKQGYTVVIKPRRCGKTADAEAFQAAGRSPLDPTVFGKPPAECPPPPSAPLE